MRVSKRSARNVAVQFLAACILFQSVVPAALASPGAARRFAAPRTSLASRAGGTLEGLAVGAVELAAGVVASVRAALSSQENWNVLLTPVNTEFHGHTGIDYHQPGGELILSANAPTGDPNSFELVGANGGHNGFSNVTGLQGDVLIATARDDGQGMSRGGFKSGTVFASTGVPGVVARISPDGASVQNPWVTLPDAAEPITGLHLDRTGVFGGDLLVVNAAGGVWRVNSSATPTRLASLGTRLAGVAVVPDDPERYGPWAGRALVGAKEQGSVYALDAQGQGDSLQVGVNPQDIDIVPAHENLYAVDNASHKLLGAAEGAFAGVIGDILVTQESPGRISRVRWDGSGFVVAGLAEAAGLKQVAFSPSGVGPISAVKQVYESIAVVRHAPQLNSGRVEGTLWQLTGESTLFDGTDTITSDLLVPGTPTLTADASANYGGTIEGSESVEPSGYALTIKGNASLRHVVTRTDPIELQDVAFPPAPQGTRDAQLRKVGDSIGDPATLRHLDITGNAGSVAVPPGTYGRFTVGGRNELVLGVAGSSAQAVYNLEELALTGGSQLRLAGPVRLRVKNSVTLVGSTVGAADDPKRLLLEIADGVGGDAVKVSGNGVLYAVVRAPQGDITIEGNGRVRGTVACDYLFVNGNGVLQITENDTPPPPVNRPPTADAGPDHTITLPIDTTALEGSASDDGLPAGSTLTITWTKVSGPGAVTFADAHSAATSASFAEPGEYVLKLTASDGQLSSSDTAAVNVIQRNQAPVVDAGAEQTIELPTPAELRGTVTDDGLPRGSAVTVTWSLVSGPGAVTFADSHSAVTSASFTLPGAYTLRLTADDTELSGSDDVVVNVLKNEAPTANAGPDKEIVLPDIVTMVGAASDDGLPRGSALEVSWTQTSGPAPAIFHDAFAATTAVTFTAPGTYVLRLTASDSQLSASDEATVVVVPKPNGPPRITSQPVKEFLLGAVPTGGGEVVSLVPWTPFQYELNSQPNANWVKDATNTVVTQTVNADASFLLSDFNLSNAQMEGTWRVNTGNDDDFIGFVFGYQNSQHFYLFDWKQASQNDPLGFAERGMSVKVFNADSPLNGFDFWPTSGNGTRVRTLFHNTVGWNDFTDYQFTLQFHPGEIKITVKQGANTLADFTVNDETYTNGRFGFYNYSQEAVRYSGFRRLSLAQGTYTYDVDAVDPDGDQPLVYSLDAAPLGMSIDPSTGIITWPVSSVAAGDHQVTVRVREPNGGFDTQTFTLTILNPNLAPVVNAGDDRTVLFGSAASLNGTATDDGFPRGATLGVSWTKVSGPGAVTFANASSAATTATFGVSGTYVLRLSATDGEQTSSDEVTVTTNKAPVVNAGTDQTVTSNTTLVNGVVSDDGVPSANSLTVLWSQTGGPGVVKFDDPGSPSTRAIFPAPGVYTLRLTGNDSLHSATDDLIVTVNASPALDGATLSLAAINVGPYATGSSQSLRATLRNSAGAPLAGYAVEFEVTGPNAAVGSAVTDASGAATFSYTGANVGADTVRAFVRNVAATIDSPVVTMTWAQASTSPPATQGWIGGPVNGGSYAGVVPVTVGAGVTITQATVDYWPAGDSSAVTTIASGAQGGPGATLAALDTTLLANGDYVIRLRATDSTGQQLVSQVLITVTGENKPGRMTLLVNDLTVPAAGLPITIDRRYDSLERNEVGDFGYGWSLEMAGPRLEVSPDNDVTITEPGTGRRVTFQFTPTSFGFPFNFLYQPTYTAEPGVFGKLATDGCGLLIKSGGGVVCYLSTDLNYRPTVYAYTDPYGRVYTMSATGKMLSIKGVDGNVLTFGPNGITSSSGNLTVAFARDSQGRVTDITDPNGKVYHYTYDSSGDLVSVKLPGVETPLRYEYDAGHFFRKGFDARGNPEAATTYYPDGRLQSATDATGKTTTYAYDLASNTTTITHPDNTGATVQRFDANGLLLSETDPLNRTKSYTYDASRNKRTETDALGKTTSYTYDANGVLNSTTDPLGKSITYVNNQFGLPSSVTDQLGKVRTLKYDAGANLTGVNDELGGNLAFTWDERGSPVSFADGEGQVTRFTNDAYGNVLSKTDPLGRVTTYTYDSMSRVETMTDARGTTRYEYDAVGRMLSVTDPLDHTTKYSYDGNGNRVEMTDARQKVTSYEYDPLNRLTKVTFPDGTTVRYTYNFRGQRLSETDQLDRTTTYEYDNAGQLVKIARPDHTELRFTYDETGRIKTATDERGKTSTYEYDPNCGCRNRMTKVVRADGTFATYRFDDAGRRVAFIDANNRETLYAYDVRDRLVRTTFPDGSFTQTTYDGAGRALTLTDQEGRVTRYAYDAAGNVKSVTDANSRVTQYDYDALNNLASMTDANGNTTRFEYDALNRVAKRVLPLGMSELFTYDPAGNLATRTDFRGKQTAYDYDALNRLVAKRPDPTLGEPAVTYAYTATGRRLSMTDAGGTTAYTYDERDRMLTKQTPQGTLAYTYDAADNVASVRSSNDDGVSVNYTYDDIGRLESVIDHRLADGVTRYGYDAVGNLKSDLRPNGVRADYNYNSLNRLTSETVGRGATSLANYAYTLDRTGRRLSVAEQSGRTVNYTYDNVYRLTRESVAGDPNPTGNGAVDYGYDPVGNRLSRISNLPGVPSASSGFDANDRLTSDAYDANGNSRAASGRTYAYDFEDRIKSADGGAVRVVYDGDGNLAAKTVGGVTTRFLVDDLNPTGYPQVVEETVGGQVQRQYTYGATIVSQRQQLGGSWSASFYTFDGHGSVRQLTDESGAVTDTYTYDAFGKLIAQTGSTPNAYLYAGERFDYDLGLYNLRARHYDADRGRFTSMDPFAGYIEEPSSLHKYLYTHADPVNFIDPEGLSEAGEYGLLTRIGIATRAALQRLSKAIQCVFLRAASWIASAVGLPAWLAVRAVAVRLGLLKCVCKMGNVPPASGTLRQWLGDEFPDLLQEALDWFTNNPEWFGIDPDKTPVRYVPPDEVRRIRKMPGESGGWRHHPHPLSLGGPPGQVLTPTSGPRDPTHNAVTQLGRKIKDVIKGKCIR